MYDYVDGKADWMAYGLAVEGEGVTVGDLFERTRVSMPHDRPGTLTRQQTADVLAYVFSANKFPAGKTELARQPELLKQIRFDATKPVR